MSDKNKSRIWSVVHEKYLSKEDFVITLDGTWQTDKAIKYANIGSLIIERCSGVQDKFKNAIYEGDIVETDIGHRGLVEFSENGWFCALNKNGRYDLLYDGAIKIIGNNNKNPELLEGWL